MRTTLVYDLPIRLFHGLFSSLFLISFVIAKTVDDESLIFSYHMLSGLLLSGLVLWRIIWGIIGTEHSRFTGLNLNPVHLKDYLHGILTGSKRRWMGHNPASSWAALTMFALSLSLAITGYMMSTGSLEAFEDIHEFFANTFIVVVVLHIAGVVLHSIRHQDGISLSMIDGKKETIEQRKDIPSSRRFAAVLLLALTISSGLYLFKNFDSQNRTLSILGQTLQLGENETENQKENQMSESTTKQNQKNEEVDDD